MGQDAVQASKMKELGAEEGFVSELGARLSRQSGRVKSLGRFTAVINDRHSVREMFNMTVGWMESIEKSGLHRKFQVVSSRSPTYFIFHTFRAAYLADPAVSGIDLPLSGCLLKLDIKENCPDLGKL